MPLSLNLPYSVCWPLVRMIRRALIHPAFDRKTFDLYPIAGQSLAGRLLRPMLSLPGFDELLNGYYTAVLQRR